MIPGFGSTGDSVYGHHLDFLNERVQPIIDFISEYLKTLGQEGELITSEDKSGLRFCASFADGLEGIIPGKEEGFTTYLDYLDENPPGLDDRATFETARGYIYASLPHKAIEVRKPTNERSEALLKEAKMKMDSNREEWIRTNPERVKEILGLKGPEENLRKVEEMVQSLPSLISKYVREEIEKRIPPPAAQETAKNEQVKEEKAAQVLPPLYLEYHAKPRYWSVETRNKSPNIEAGIVYPDGSLSGIPLSILILDEESGSNVASADYEVNIANIEAYEALFNRLKFVISEFLDARNDGDLVTDLMLRQPTEASSWVPVTKEDGRPLRKASTVEIERLGEDAVLEIRLGRSFMRVGISFVVDRKIVKENAARFLEDVSRVTEMVLRTADVIRPPKVKA